MGWGPSPSHILHVGGACLMELARDIQIKNDRKRNWMQKGENQKRVFLAAVVGPAFAAYLLFGLYPNIMSFYYAFLEWDGVGPKKFVGLFNFNEMIKDPFMWRALYHNLLLMIAVPIVIVMLSVILADLLASKTFRENKVYKVIYFFPNVLSTVVIGLIWVFIFDGQFGLLNAILKIIGIDMKNFYWLGDEGTSLLAVAIPIIWSAIGFYVVILMNAMSSIPNSLYESAILDGIGHWRRLFQITLPLISGVIRVSIIFIILNLLKGFEMIMILTAGGPAGSSDVIGLYMYSYAFGGTYTGGSHGTSYGYASAIGMLLMLILIGLKLIVDKFFTKEAVEY